MTLFLGTVICGALAVLLSFISERVFGGNSDGATVVLEGQSIATGHLLLQGWALSRDSFWSADALVYGAYATFRGVAHEALFVVPSLLAVGCVGIGLFLVRRERQGWPFVAGAGALVVLLGFPSPTLSFFLLQGPWHIGTALWSLVAFAGLSGARYRWGFVLAVAALCLGLLGDLETAAYGVVPIVLTGFSEMCRSRSLRAGGPAMLAGPLAAGVAWLARLAVRSGGGFSMAAGLTESASSHYLTNLGHGGSWLAGLFGVVRIPIGPSYEIGAGAVTNGDALSKAAHLALFLVVIISLALALFTWARGVIFGDARIARDARSLRIDDFLLFGAAGSVASFVFLCPNGNGDYARYLIGAAIFCSVLAARTVARGVSRFWNTGRALRLVTGAVACFVLVGVVSETVTMLEGPIAPATATALTSFLEDRHLHVGVGDYWSSSIASVTSDGRVAIRPVITAPSGRLVRYERQSSASWYRGVRFQFLVYNVRHPWRQVDAKTAITTFGRPSAAYVVGDYRVIVWPRPLTVSPGGFTRG